jgi:hypothetical protein
MSKFDDALRTAHMKVCVAPEQDGTVMSFTKHELLVVKRALEFARATIELSNLRQEILQD